LPKDEDLDVPEPSMPEPEPAHEQLEDPSP